MKIKVLSIIIISLFVLIGLSGCYDIKEVEGKDNFVYVVVYEKAYVGSEIENVFFNIPGMSVEMVIMKGGCCKKDRNSYNTE